MQIVSKYAKGHNSFQIKVQIRKLEFTFRILGEPIRAYK